VLQVLRVLRVLRAQMEVMVLTGLTGLTELLAHKAQREVTGRMAQTERLARGWLVAARLTSF